MMHRLIFEQNWILFKKKNVKKTSKEVKETIFLLTAVIQKVATIFQMEKSTKLTTNIKNKRRMTN